MRFVVDAGTLLHLLAEDIEVSDEIRLVAPTLVRSQVLSALYEAVLRGEILKEVGRDRLARFGAMKMRLLGDQVLRRRAWAIAEKMGWDSTYVAEYVALTQLQADAFVTMDVGLARSVEGVVETATVAALQ
jgi:indolepyruvate ferredoxin oxidoreductase alpha subunit